MLQAPSGASEELRHAVELVNRDLDGLLEGLDTHQQAQFWENLHHYALAHVRHKRRNPHLVASPEKVDAAVREALELADEKFIAHLEGLAGLDHDRFWRMLHEVAERQEEATEHSRARQVRLS